MQFPGESMCMSPILFVWVPLAANAGAIFYAWHFEEKVITFILPPREGCLGEEDLFRVWTWEKGFQGHIWLR
jgi:hypothetical protein